MPGTPCTHPEIEITREMIDLYDPQRPKPEDAAHKKLVPSGLAEARCKICGQLLTREEVEARIRESRDT